MRGESVFLVGVFLIIFGLINLAPSAPTPACATAQAKAQQQHYCDCEDCKCGVACDCYTASKNK